MTSRCSPGFERLLESYPLQVEQYDGVAYGLWPDFRLAYFNPGWVRFARENGGHPSLATESYLGTSVIDVTPPFLKPFYRLKFLSGLHPTHKRPRPIQHRYECSSPELFREFVMTLYPLREAKGLLVVNSLVVEQPHDPAAREPREPDQIHYMDERGLIHQCTHCRRVRNLRHPRRWDWVPVWVEQFPPEVSHTLCPFCLDYYYLEADPDVHSALADVPAVE